MSVNIKYKVVEVTSTTTVGFRYKIVETSAIQIGFRYKVAEVSKTPTTLTLEVKPL